MNFWQWFSEQFAKSNIISGLLALAIWGAVIFLAITGGVIPDILYVGGTTVIAFFFGSKQGAREERRVLMRDVDNIVRGVKRE